jgi:hypothetical protein
VICVVVKDSEFWVNQIGIKMADQFVILMSFEFSNLFVRGMNFFSQIQK